MARIPVKLIRIEDITEVSMDLDDFESSGVEIGDNVKALKDGYDELIAEVKPVLSRNAIESSCRVCHWLRSRLSQTWTPAIDNCRLIRS